MDQYTLTKGHYVICDPAYMMLKNKEGDQFNQKVINQFFKEMNKFHHFIIDGITFYMFRSLGGDGIFDGVGTDTGTIIIIETTQLKDDIRFRQDYSRGAIIHFDVDEPVIATVDNFDLSISNGIKIHTE